MDTILQPFKGGQLVAQRNRLILSYLSWANLGSSCEAGWLGRAKRAESLAKH
jgi:hypothetical protein